MAENKKSFLLYCDLIHTVKKLPKEKQGELFITILEYVNDMNPQVNDLNVDLVFEPIKRQLKRDLTKYEVTKGDRSKAGQLGNLRRWNEDLYNKVVDEKLTLDEANIIAKSRKTSQSDKVVANIAVTDTVTVTDNVIDNNKINFDKLLSYLNSKTNRNFQVINSTIKNKYKARLKDGYLKEDIITAIDNATSDEFHKDNNYKYLTPEFFSRQTTLDKWSNVGNDKNGLTKIEQKAKESAYMQEIEKMRKG